MNYKKVYDALINKAILRGKIYPKERHHIVPKSMGGSDRKDNLVYLTPREHIIAHKMLWKIYRNKQMSCALWMMQHTRSGIKLTSKQYEILKIEHAVRVSEINTGRVVTNKTREKLRQANLGKKKSVESKAKMSNSQKGRISPMKGRKHTQKSKDKNSVSNKGRIAWNKGIKYTEEQKAKLDISGLEKGHGWNKGISATPQAKENMSIAQKKSQEGKPGTFTGKKHTEETKKQMRESAKNKPAVTEETKKKLRKKKKARPTLICPHCGKIGDASGLKRWHYDNCKLKQ